MYIISLATLVYVKKSGTEEVENANFKIYGMKNNATIGE